MEAVVRSRYASSHRITATPVGRVLEQYNLTWIEEPLDAYDAEGHAARAATLDTPIATGEMLTSVGEHTTLIKAGSSDFVQPDAPRVGGITPFLQIAALATVTSFIACSLRAVL
ncbi:enolase C-terminal domain-like protein [Streptomyces acidicola]